MKGLGAFTDWRITLGSHLGRPLIVALCLLAAAAVAVSALSLWRSPRRGQGISLLLLRTAAVAACLGTALQPSLELGQVSRVPNHVAVLVDASRSMGVKPPDGGPSRLDRAAAVVAGAQSTLDAWQREGHQVELYRFGESLNPATVPGLSAEPHDDATRIGEALSELRGRYAGQDMGGVVIVSDGIDTGRTGRGPLDAETRRAVTALGAPISTIWVGEAALRDLSVAAVLADNFAFVRTPVKLEAVLRASGLPHRQVEITLSRDGRLVDGRSVVLEDDQTEKTVTFDWTPDRPGNFVFEIATPVLAGEALASNNKQIFTIKVIRDRVRVLHVCGRPSWDQRFLRSLLRLDPNVDLVSFFILRNSSDEMYAQSELSLIHFPEREIFDEQLKSFDLLIFDNFNYGPYGVEPYLPGVRDYIQSGGALAMIGGDLSFAGGDYARSALRDVLPVDLDGIPPTGERSMTQDSFRPRLTTEGKGHPITALSLDSRSNETRWGALPALEGINRVARLKAGASALLVHPTAQTDQGQPAPVLAVADVGKGRTMALLTDTAWHWGFLAAGAGDDGRAFQHFWEGAIHWLVHDPALTLLRLELGRVEYRKGQPVALRVRTLRPDYTPAAATIVTLKVLPVASVNQDKPLRVETVTTGPDGEASLELGGLPAGAYRLAGQATVDGRALTEEQTFVVRPEGRELEDVVARTGLLQELAALTGGDFQEGTFGHPAVKKAREVRVGKLRTIEIWTHPGLLVLALLLLATEWTLRRRLGHG